MVVWGSISLGEFCPDSYRNRGVAVRTNNPYITFGRAEKIFSGNGGCNQIVGRFEVDGTSLTFSHLAGTRLACLDSDAQQIETDFIKALEQTTHFRLQDDVLSLYNSDSLMLVFQPNPPTAHTPNNTEGLLALTARFSPECIAGVSPIKSR